MTNQRLGEYLNSLSECSSAAFLIVDRKYMTPREVLRRRANDRHKELIDLTKIAGEEAEEYERNQDEQAKREYFESHPEEGGNE